MLRFHKPSPEKEGLFILQNTSISKTLSERHRGEDMKTHLSRISTLIAAALIIMSIPAKAEVLVCNGSSTLCDRRYNEVVFAGSHNAMSSADAGWILPNHYLRIEKQLEFGVRALNLDIYVYAGEVYMCHSDCAFGRRSLKDALSAVKRFMEDNPGEIITINFQDETRGEIDVACVFEEAGLSEYASEHNTGEDWPTLREMIDSGKRLVVLGKSGYSRAPWFLVESEHAWASPYYAETVRQFECGAPEEGRQVYILSHFLTAPYAMPPLAAKANKKDIIVGRAARCWKETGRRPNIILFDFATVGDVVEAVSILNEMRDPSDRRPISRQETRE